MDIQLSIPEQFQPALAALLTSFDYAQDSGSDACQFAIGLSELLSTGATLPDLRWLVLRKFAVHAKEITIPGDEQRSFRPLAPTCFADDSCFSLLPAGAAAVRALLSNSTVKEVLAESSASATNVDGDSLPAEFDAGQGDDSCSRSQRGADEGQVGLLIPSFVVQQPTTPNDRRPDPTPRPPPKPVWDSAHRELRYLGQVVKRYRVPARNQEMILEAFQEDDWPEFIDDPIPPERDQDPKRRLNVTIKSLNRNQLAPLVRFHGNGNGLQIHWEAVERGS